MRSNNIKPKEISENLAWNTSKPDVMWCNVLCSWHGCHNPVRSSVQWAKSDSPLLRTSGEYCQWPKKSNKARNLWFFQLSDTYIGGPESSWHKNWKSVSFSQNLNILGKNSISKAILLQEDIFFLIHLFASDILLLKKLEIEKTKTT